MDALKKVLQAAEGYLGDAPPAYCASQEGKELAVAIERVKRLVT